MTCCAMHGAIHLRLIGVGYAAKEVLEQSRATIAECLGVDADEIFFTSGATEANNLAVRGLAWRARTNRGAL